MKNLFLAIAATFSFFAFACGLAGKTQTSAENNLNSNSSSAHSVSQTGEPLPEATPTKKNSNANARKNAENDEPLPRKIDDSTAESPVYQINSKNCKNLDDQGSEGEGMIRKCKAYENYSLWIYGEDTSDINYRVQSEKTGSDFTTHFSPVMDGDAWKYNQNTDYVQKLADKIFWILDDHGKPYAIFIHASFYKSKGAKNKVAEFVFLRGLEGYQDIDTDIDAVDTAYNPDEQAKMIAYKVLEKSQQ